MNYYHISKSEGIDADFTNHGSESPDNVVSIEEASAPAKCQNGYKNIVHIIIRMSEQLKLEDHGWNHGCSQVIEYESGK